MKCNHPKHKTTSKVIFATISHGLFGEICLECQNRIDSQKQEVAVKVEKVRREYEKNANRNREAKVEKRRKVLKSILGGMVSVDIKHKAPLTEIHKRIRKRGFDVGAGTVKRDLNQMGWRCNNGRFERMGAK